MCKNTDASIGITVHHPPVMPPIENWYVVACTKSTGTCSIYSSWENYRAESKPILTTPSSSPSAAEKKKKKKPTVNAAKAIEVAAFPTMAQTIVYIKSFDRPTTKSVSSSSLASSISRSTIAGERIRPSNSPPDDSKSSGLQDTAAGAASDSDTSRGSHMSHPYKRRLYKSARKIIQVIDEDDDCHNDSTTSNDDRAATHAKSSPIPIPSESPIKKRKTEIGTSQSSSVPIFTKRLTMSQTSETIDIGGPTTRTEPNTSSLDALATAASKSNSEKVRKSTTSDESNKNARTVASPSATALASPNRRTEDIIPRGATHLMSPREINLPGMAHLPENTTRRSIVASNIAARNSVNPKQYQMIMQKLKEEQEFQHQQQMEQNRQRRNTSLVSSLIIPKVPTTFLASSLKIPEVPKGIIPAPADHQHPDQISRAITDLKSSLDRKLWRLPSVPSIALQSAANRMSLDSYPLGNFPRQLEHLPQHLQAIQQQQEAMYRTSSHMQGLQLQPPHNHLNHHLLSSGAFRHHFQQQQQQQQQQHHMYPQTIDLVSSPSVTSDCDHSEVTLKRRNGPSSRASSPARFQRNIKSPIRHEKSGRLSAAEDAGERSPR